MAPAASTQQRNSGHRALQAALELALRCGDLDVDALQPRKRLEQAHLDGAELGRVFASEFERRVEVGVFGGWPGGGAPSVVKCQTGPVTLPPRPSADTICQ